MSFKDYIKETDDFEMNVIAKCDELQEKFINTLKVVYDLKMMISDVEENRLLNGVSLLNAIEQIETRLDNVGTMISKLNSTIVGIKTSISQGGTESPSDM